MRLVSDCGFIYQLTNENYRRFLVDRAEGKHHELLCYGKLLGYPINVNKMKDPAKEIEIFDEYLRQQAARQG
jgi:hypothetical protein